MTQQPSPKTSLEYSEENLRLQEELAKKSRELDEARDNIAVLKQVNEDLKSKDVEARGAVIRSRAERGEEVGEFAEAVRNVESLKKVWQGLLEAKAYENVAELLDASLVMKQIQDALKEARVLEEREHVQMKEASTEEAGQLQTNLGTIANALSELVDRINLRNRERSELWSLERSVLMKLDDYLDRWR